MYKNFPSLLHLAISFLNDFIMLLDLETARIEHQWGLHLRFRKLVLTTVVPESLKQYPQLVTTQLLFSCDIKILQISNYRHCFRDVWTKNVADISVNEDCPLQDFPGGPAVKNLPTTSGDTDLISGPGRPHMLWATKPMHHNYWARGPESPFCATRSHNKQPKHLS